MSGAESPRPHGSPAHPIVRFPLGILNNREPCIVLAGKSESAVL